KPRSERGDTTPTIRHPRASPEGVLSGDLVPKIAPVGIVLLDERVFPIAIPALQRSFALNGHGDIAKGLEIDEPLYVSGFGVSGNETFPMLVNAADEIIGDTNIGAPPPHIRKNIDISAHNGILKYSALGSSPRVT